MSDQQLPPRLGGNGGASLFTPAYRASHAAAGTYPGLTDQLAAPVVGDGAGRPDALDTGYGWAHPNQPGAGYGWDDRDEPVTGSDQATGDQPGSGYAWDDPDGQVTGYSPADPDQPDGYSWDSDDLAGAGHSWSRPSVTGHDPAVRAVSNAVRGFPPAPDEPLPSYPPGPFAIWNRSAAEGGASALTRTEQPADVSADGHADSPRQLASATITPAEFDTDYSLPAIKDPVLGRARAGADPRRDGSVSAGAAHSRAGRQRGGGAHGAESVRAGGHASKQPVWLAIGAAVVVIAAVAVFLLTSLGGTPKHSNPQSSKGGSSGKTGNTGGPGLPKPPPGKWAYIGSRSTDQIALTMSELYPVSFTIAGTYYIRSVTTASVRCRAALIGIALQSAVRKAGCTQVVRATYLSRGTKMMGTVGVFNLLSFATATTAARAAGQSEFVAQLPASVGPTRHIASGTGIEEALVKGHYLILVWAGSTNLRAPKTAAQRSHLESYMNLLVKQSVNVSLSYRMVEGKPLPPG